MRFLLTGPLTPAVAAAIVRHGHETATLESLTLTELSPKQDVLKAATKAQLDIVTSDPVMADAPYAHNLFFPRTIIFLQLPGGDVEQDDAIDRLFTRYKRLTPKRLYTVTEGRVKVRQLPGAV